MDTGVVLIKKLRGGQKTKWCGNETKKKITSNPINKYATQLTNQHINMKKMRI